MKKTGIYLALLVICIVSGCVGPAAVEDADDGSGPLVGLYNLNPLDPLYISFLGIPEEKAIEPVIDEYGQITLPYIQEPVEAAGKSVSELEREIKRIYIEDGIYKNITVNIQTSAKSYYMEGEVNGPQEYPLNRRITLLQAIAAAGGYTDYANKKDITITRRGKVIKANAKEIEENPELDIPLEAGDRIKVDRTFY